MLRGIAAEELTIEGPVFGPGDEILYRDSDSVITRERPSQRAYDDSDILLGGRTPPDEVQRGVLRQMMSHSALLAREAVDSASQAFSRTTQVLREENSALQRKLLELRRLRSLLEPSGSDPVAASDTEGGEEVEDG